MVGVRSEGCKGTVVKDYDRYCTAVTMPAPRSDLTSIARISTTNIGTTRLNGPHLMPHTPPIDGVNLFFSELE